MPLPDVPVQAAPTSTHGLRVRRILHIVSFALVGSGLGWGLYFWTQRNFTVLLMDAGMVALGLALTWMIRTGRVRAASLLVLPGVAVVVVVMSLLQDVPTLAAPRSLHHYLLALSVGGYVLLRDETRWLRHGLVLMTFALYIGLASTHWGLDTSMALPDAIREPGSWINTGLAMLMLYACLHVMQADLREQGGMVQALRRALRAGEFVLHYQPQSGADGGIGGAEALVRWNDPRKGLVLPGQFIPEAEDSGLILPLGNWVLNQACAQLAVWGQDATMRGLSLSVNVSAQQFRQADFVAGVLAALARHGARAELLKLELTESLLARDLDDIVGKMRALRAHGVRLSLDDFGTGYSSLNYLKWLPLDQLKIDQSFVRDLLHDPQDAAIARTVVTLGQSLGLEVIAEGVETPAQRDFLRSLGCNSYQGFLLSPALPAAAFDAFVRGHVRDHVPAPAPGLTGAAEASPQAPAVS